MAELSRVVTQEIARRFEPQAREVVTKGLEQLELPLAEPDEPRDRVHLAILLASGGSLDDFHEALDLAHQDWRDILVRAGLEHEDWRDVLRRLGIEQ